MRKILSGFSMLFLLVLTQSTTHADPIVITSGNFTVAGIAGGPTFTLTGDNFSVTSTGGEPGNLTPQVLCFPCPAGTLISMDGVFVGQSLGQGTATINGTVFSNVDFAGTFVFDTQQFIFSPFPGPTDHVLQTAFTFTGQLQGCPTSCVTNPPVFTFDLIGSGVVDLELQFAGFNSQGVQLFTFQRVNYSFRNEIPEPVSLLLLSSGLAALGLKLRRSRTK